ncbi:DDE superfamily endonuclease [Nitrosomonas sp. Nm34]|nr:DDE superfamily endonuclease [Nitrosomonas sp. Nm34]
MTLVAVMLRLQRNSSGCWISICVRISISLLKKFNAQSTVALLQQIEQQHPFAARIYIICDNARYYRSQLVTEYLSDSKIELIFLPPYAPNLNLIERYWRFFKK